MMLSDAGYRGTAVPDDADVLIVNTCGFLQAAEDESLANLRELADSKRRGQVLIAAGCMAQRNGSRIVQEVPGVDGSARHPALDGGRAVHQGASCDEAASPESSRAAWHAGCGPSRRLWSLCAARATRSSRLPIAMPRPRVQNGSAYLKISDGCNAPCAFCSIPSFKGKLRSRPLDAVVAEARSPGRLRRAGADPDRPGHNRLRPRPRPPGPAARPDVADPAGDAGLALAAADVRLSGPRLRSLDRGDGVRPARLPLPGHPAPARAPGCPAPHVPTEQHRQAARNFRRDAARDARHGLPQHVHRGPARRDRGGVPGPARLRPGDPVRQGRRLHLQPRTGHARGRHAGAGQRRKSKTSATSG